MKVQIKLIESTPEKLWTTGEVKNLGAQGSPTVTQARTALGEGTRFISRGGTHAYRFMIVGEGTVKIQAFDADTGHALAAATAFDTAEVHGGHTYVFEVT